MDTRLYVFFRLILAKLKHAAYLFAAHIEGWQHQNDPIRITTCHRFYAGTLAFFLSLGTALRPVFGALDRNRTCAFLMVGEKPTTKPEPE